MTIPPAVVDELAEGRKRGYSLPDPTQESWMHVRAPARTPSLQRKQDLGPGETAVLALVLEMPNGLAILDDALARQEAALQKIAFTGTLGILLDAKRNGLIPAVKPLLDQLQSLRFRLAHHTYETILKQANEQ